MSEQMRIAVLTAPHTIEVDEEPVPEPGADEVLLRVAACGVCASELDMWTGEAGKELPWHPGHEVSGVVERAGPAAPFREGDRVAAWVTERGFADYVAVRGDYCLPAGELPLDLALAEPVACAVNAVELAAPALGDDVVVIGGGFMGSLVQKLVQLKGPRHVIVADTRAEVLERATAMGATHTVDVRATSLEDGVAAVLGDDGADVTFEVTGVQAPLDAMGAVTRQSGKVVIVGYHQGGTRTLPLADWNWNAFEIVNAHFREVATIMRGMRVGMRLLTSGRLDIADLVTHRFPLEGINDAFEVAHSKPEGFVKSTVLMNGRAGVS